MTEIAPVEHPTVFIQEELDARGWDRWDLAHHMGGVIAINKLSLDMYFEVGPDQPDLLLGDETANQLGRAFGVSPEFFLNLHAAWRRAQHVH